MEFVQQEKSPVYRVLCDVSGTRYVELSTSYDSDCFWHDAIERTEVGFEGNRVILYELHSDQAPVKLSFTQDKVALLSLMAADYLLKENTVAVCLSAHVIDASISTLTAYLEALKAASQRAHALEEDTFDPLASLDDHPF